MLFWITWPFFAYFWDKIDICVSIAKAEVRIENRK